MVKEQLDSKEEGRKEIFYLTMHSTHFIYKDYMALNIIFLKIHVFGVFFLKLKIIKDTIFVGFF